MSYTDHELSWDDSISRESSFELLPEGDYNFRVLKFERGRHPGSDKLPPCNKAILTVEVTDGVHTGTLETNLFLHTKTEGILCAFFAAIGQRRHGENLVPRWNEVMGSAGCCKVGVRSWKGNDGQERQSNEIRTWYEKGKQIELKQPAPPIQQAAYTPGAF